MPLNLWVNAANMSSLDISETIKSYLVEKYLLNDVTSMGMLTYLTVTPHQGKVHVGHSSEPAHTCRLVLIIILCGIKSSLYTDF